MMQAPRFSFEPLTRADLPTLCAWLGRPHVSRWWGAAPSPAEVEVDHAPSLEPGSTTRACIAHVDGRPLGFVQSYVALDAGDGWWTEETDPGARGIDAFIAAEADLGRGLGSAMVGAFVDLLFDDPAVTKVQADPSPANTRAIACYLRAGFSGRGVVATPDGPALLMVRQRAGDSR